jgi:hypothetical protein
MFLLIPAGFARWPQVDLRFRLASTAARESGGKTPALTFGSEAGHDAMANRTGAETTVTKDVDFYTELKKLGELKEKGCSQRTNSRKRRSDCLTPETNNLYFDARRSIVDCLDMDLIVIFYLLFLIDPSIALDQVEESLRK